MNKSFAAMSLYKRMNPFSWQNNDMGFASDSNDNDKYEQSFFYVDGI
ncbi:MAG: hypothetical protein ABI683_15475 [Ginsengibacter sp.]